MNRKRMLLGLALIGGVALWNPAILFAGEHGGKEGAKEHGGKEPGAQEHGGTAVEGGHAHAATLMEAADALRATHPDLASKLEAIAEEME